jgi:hypothetical protein
VRGWARSWSLVYGWLADQLDQNDALREATLLVRYEDFCEGPAEMLQRVLAHVELDEAPSVLAFADRIQPPGYYRPDFSPEDLAVIDEETAAVAEQFGYAPAHCPIAASAATP